ncbi:16295_t:CDS:2, partial [Funneliformis mosseae]
KKRSATDLISTSLIIPDNEVPLQADGSLDILELKASTNRQYTKVPRESVYDADELILYNWLAK